MIPRKLLVNFTSCWFPDVEIEHNCICFDINNFRNKPDEIENQANEYLSTIRLLNNYLCEQINNFNSSLSGVIRNLIIDRKEQLNNRENLLSSLGVPIKKKSNVPPTFTIPTQYKSKKTN